MRVGIALPIMVAAACLISTHALASSGRATDTVRGMVQEVIAIQNDPGLQGRERQAAKKSEIEDVIIRNFNFDAMIKGALGPYYNSLNEAKLAEFRSAFQHLFLKSYSNLVADFVKTEKVAYKGESEGNDQVTVKTVMRSAGSDISVDYSLMRNSGKYQVKDVSADGVSLVSNYRDAFSRVMKQEGYDGLLKRMKLQEQAEGK